MIPNHIYNLTAFPLNKTGKIDRSRLIDLTTIKKAGKNTDKLFLSVTERSLLDIYKEILEVDFVDVNEGFFDLGGDSLSLVFLLSRIEEVFEQELSMMQFSTQNSVREIAKFLDNGIGLTRDKISLIEFDEILEGTLQQSERIHVGHKKVALLTGATGFVGAFLLEELLGSYKQVYCLIRANDPDEAEAKLKTSVSKYALQIDFSR